MTEAGSHSLATELDGAEVAVSSGFAASADSNDHEEPLANNIGLAELYAMEHAYRALQALTSEARGRAFNWLAAALDIPVHKQDAHPHLIESRIARTQQPSTGSSTEQMSPREFISHKRPESLVERVACLAYYLTRYRGINHFKTADIVALNTEAAAHRFGNPSRDVDNADRHNGFLVSAGNGKKQLTVRGEAVVDALPDRESVRTALKNHPHKSRRSSGTAKRTTTQKPEP